MNRQRPVLPVTPDRRGEKPIRVVRVVSRLNVGGVARHGAWLTAGLRERGFGSVLVNGVVPPGEEDMSGFAAAQGVEPVASEPEQWRDVIKHELDRWGNVISAAGIKAE